MRRLVAFSSTSRWTKAALARRAGSERWRRGWRRGRRLCGRSAPRTGSAWTILRPTLIYAEGRDGNVSRLAALARRFGVLPVSGAGAAGASLSTPTTSPPRSRRCSTAEATRDRAYDLPGGETLTYRAMCVRVFEGLGRPPRLLHAPPAVWKLALAAASPWLPGATAAMGERMAQDLVFDPAPARRDFGWTSRDFHPDFRRPPIR